MAARLDMQLYVKWLGTNVLYSVQRIRVSHVEGSSFYKSQHSVGFSTHCGYLVVPFEICGDLSIIEMLVGSSFVRW